MEEWRGETLGGDEDTGWNVENPGRQVPRRSLRGRRTIVLVGETSLVDGCLEPRKTLVENGWMWVWESGPCGLVWARGM